MVYASGNTRPVGVTTRHPGPSSLAAGPTPAWPSCCRAPGLRRERRRTSRSLPAQLSLVGPPSVGCPNSRQRAICSRSGAYFLLQLVSHGQDPGLKISQGTPTRSQRPAASHRPIWGRPGSAWQPDRWPASESDRQACGGSACSSGHQRSADSCLLAWKKPTARPLERICHRARIARKAQNLRHPLVVVVYCRAHHGHRLHA